MISLMACPLGTVTFDESTALQTRFLPAAEYVGFVSVRKFAPLNWSVAVTAGLAGITPLVTVMKLVMVTRLFDGITNDEQNTGVCVKTVTLVALAVSAPME